MPKGAPRTSSAKLTEGKYTDTVTSRGPTGSSDVKNTKAQDLAEARNRVGDQGVEKLKNTKYNSSTDDREGNASSSDAQETPAAKKARLKAARDAFDKDLVDKVKNATAQRGGALVRSNYGS